MGKGDKKTRRGKIILGTYGKRRPRKIHNTVAKPVEEVKVKEPRKKEAVQAVAEKAEKKEAKAPKDKAPKVPKEKKESGEKKDKKS